MSGRRKASSSTPVAANAADDSRTRTLTHVELVNSDFSKPLNRLRQKLVYNLNVLRFRSVAESPSPSVRIFFVPRLGVFNSLSALHCPHFIACTSFDLAFKRRLAFARAARVPRSPLSPTCCSNRVWPLFKNAWPPDPTEFDLPSPFVFLRRGVASTFPQAVAMFTV